MGFTMATAGRWVCLAAGIIGSTRWSWPGHVRRSSLLVYRSCHGVRRGRPETGNICMNWGLPGRLRASGAQR